MRTDWIVASPATNENAFSVVWCNNWLKVNRTCNRFAATERQLCAFYLMMRCPNPFGRWANISARARTLQIKSTCNTKDVPIQPMAFTVHVSPHGFTCRGGPIILFTHTRYILNNVRSLARVPLQRYSSARWNRKKKNAWTCALYFECNKPGKIITRANKKRIIFLRALRDRLDKMYNNLISRIMTLEL